MIKSTKKIILNVRGKCNFNHNINRINKKLRSKYNTNIESSSSDYNNTDMENFNWKINSNLSVIIMTMPMPNVKTD